MKTTYQKPTTEMIILNVQQMVCFSEKVNLSSDSSESVNDVNDLQSRQSFSIWGDDDEE